MERTRQRHVLPWTKEAGPDPEAGVDRYKALRHIHYILGSWEPKHEHKEAGAAFLFNEWFEDAKWEPEDKKAE